MRYQYVFACFFGLFIPLLSYAQLNPIQKENLNTGTQNWELSNPAISREIEGYADLTSVNISGRVKFLSAREMVIKASILRSFELVGTEVSVPA